MAEKKTVTFDSIMLDLREGRYAPVYILMGEETYYIDRIADFIAANALTEEERDFNQTIVFGSDAAPNQIVDMARRYPMMAERQVVIVKEAQNIKNWECIERYVEKPVMTTVLVFCYKNGSIDGRKKILSKTARVGVVFESKKKRDNELPAFIEYYLKNRKATIENKAAQMIADHVGTDLSRLTSELDKLLLSLPENDRRITPDIVEDRIGVSKDFNAYELRNAIINRDVVKANRILYYFNSNPKVKDSSYSLIPMLFSYFQNLLIAYYAPQPHTDENVARWLDLRAGWAARDYTTGMRNYTGKKVLQIISKIRETDAKSKGLDNPNTPIGELLRELIFFILH